MGDEDKDDGVHARWHGQGMKIHDEKRCGIIVMGLSLRFR